MAIKGDSKTITGSDYERTRGFSVVWPYGNPLPSISATREKMTIDDAGVVMAQNGEETRPLDAGVIAGKSYTAGGITASGAQIIALVTKVLDEECADFFQ